jgi:hypothetical protein
VNDATATQAYLHASEAYARVEHAEAGASVAAMEARAKLIGADCPYALTYAPRDAAFEELGEEANRTLLYAGLVPIRTATLRMAGTLDHLSWSDRALTALVHGEAAEERALATLALPNLCSDIAAWKASAYSALPDSTRRFFVRAEAVESGSRIGPSEESREESIMRLLRRYEGPVGRRAAARIERLLARNGRLLTAAAAGPRAKLGSALGVSTL